MVRQLQVATGDPGGCEGDRVVDKPDVPGGTVCVTPPPPSVTVPIDRRLVNLTHRKLQGKRQVPVFPRVSLLERELRFAVQAVTRLKRRGGAT